VRILNNCNFVRFRACIFGSLLRNVAASRLCDRGLVDGDRREWGKREVSGEKGGRAYQDTQAEDIKTNRGHGSQLNKAKFDASEGSDALERSLHGEEVNVREYQPGSRTRGPMQIISRCTE